MKNSSTNKNVDFETLEELIKSLNKIKHFIYDEKVCYDLINKSYEKKRSRICKNLISYIDEYLSAFD